LNDDATDDEILHELTHIIHWDLQDENGIQQEVDEQMALVRQAWEEGIAVFVELEFTARKLMASKGIQAKDREIAQERLNIFGERYLKDASFDQTVIRFRNLLEAVGRVTAAQKAKASEQVNLKAGQLIADIKTIATSKDTVYDIGYHFVIDVMKVFVALGSTQQEAIAFVMAHPPVSLEEIIDANSYISRLN
jgi:hypothetical protein